MLRPTLLCLTNKFLNRSRVHLSLHLKTFSSSRVLRTSFDNNEVDALSTIPIKNSLSAQRSVQLLESKERRLQQIRRSLPEGETDILSETLIKSANMKNLMDLIDLHHSVMNNRHITETFESLHDMLKMSGSFESDLRLLLASQQFKMLCNRTFKRMRFFQTAELLTILKSLVFLEISPQTMIIQSLLQMARHRINEFSLDQIIFLDFLLSRRLFRTSRVPMERFSDEENTTTLLDEELDNNTSHLNAILPERKRPTIIPLVDALKLAIPLVIQLKIESKELDFDDIDMVIKCLRMATERNIKDEVVNSLVTAVSVKVHKLTINHATNVISSFMAIKKPHPNLNTGLIEKVLMQCLDILTAPGIKLHESFPRLHLVNTLIANGLGKSKIEIYHKGLNNLCANLAIDHSQEWGLYKSIQVLTSLTRFEHIDFALMDFIAEKIAREDPSLMEDRRTSFSNVLNAFALPSNYKPANGELVFEGIINSKSTEQCRKMFKYILFRMLKNFFILGYYPSNFINQTLEEIDDAMSMATNFGGRRDLLMNLLIINQGLYLENTDKNAISQSNLDKLKPYIDEITSLLKVEYKNKQRLQSLRNCLIQGIGGEQFVVNSIFSEFGHFIDHLVVMRKGDFPVSICQDKDVIYLNELDLPHDSKRIAVIPLTARDYCRNPIILKGETDFKIRTLKKAGIIPLMVNIESWDTLMDREKIPFLMREIQEVCKVQEQQPNKL